MPARLRLAARGRTQLRFVAPSLLARFRCPPRPVVVMQTRVSSVTATQRSAAGRHLRASPAHARQTLHRATASSGPARARMGNADDRTTGNSGQRCYDVQVADKERHGVAVACLRRNVRFGKCVLTVC